MLSAYNHATHAARASPTARQSLAPPLKQRSRAVDGGSAIAERDRRPRVRERGQGQLLPYPRPADGPDRGLLGPQRMGRDLSAWGTFEFLTASGTAAGSHSCRVRADGTVACWGDDSHGESSPPRARSSRSAPALFTPAGGVSTTPSPAGGSTSTAGRRRPRARSRRSAPAVLTPAGLLTSGAPSALASPSEASADESRRSGHGSCAATAEPETAQLGRAHGEDGQRGGDGHRDRRPWRLVGGDPGLRQGEGVGLAVGRVVALLRLPGGAAGVDRDGLAVGRVVALLCDGRGRPRVVGGLAGGRAGEGGPQQCAGERAQDCGTVDPTSGEHCGLLAEL